jgi:dTDP-4-amino-4,6-dideoxygalactose transaminase
VLPVHLGGRLCDAIGLAQVAEARGAVLVEDACHALGSRALATGSVGGCRRSAAATFSFHPVKTIACGEGGMTTTRDRKLAERMRRLRNHGVTRDAHLMSDAALSFGADGEANPWSYEQLELGFNYRMTEMEGALGVSQLGKLERFVQARTVLARRYDAVLAPLGPLVRPVAQPLGDRTALHLYQVLVDWKALGLDRAAVMRALVARGIGTQVHYIPIHRQPYFAKRYGRLRLPGAEAFYSRVLALPLFPAMSSEDVDRAALEFARALGR